MCYGTFMTGGARRGVIVLAAALSVAAAGSPLTPEETVRRYLQAVKEAKFDVAYGLISRAMKGGKDREVWIKEQQRLTQWADVKIFDFHVYPGKVEGDKAQVPNVLSSQDRFANQLGLTEHEVYTLVKEDGAWKVDQQVIVEPPDIPKWFPKQGETPGGAAAPPSH
jgi:hypothetical protein